MLDVRDFFATCFTECTMEEQQLAMTEDDTASLER